MVFASLQTLENNVSSITAGAGTFTNLKSQPNGKNIIMNAPREISRPSYDPNDGRSMLKALIRFVMRTFYEIPKSLVIEYIYYHNEIKQQDLAERLCLDPKDIRSYIQDFKRDNFIVESLRLESQEGTSGRRTQDQYYYKIDTERFINVVKYRLTTMINKIESLERDQTSRQASYRCEGCRKEYSIMDIRRIFNLERNALICTHCNEAVVEDAESKEESNNEPRQTINMSLYNEQMKIFFEILEKIDQFYQEQQARNTNETDGFLNPNNNPNDNHLSRSHGSAHHHPSQGSSMFERTSQMKHDIEIIIEKDDDEYDTQMEVDETSNAESTISSSRGNGKLNKKVSKPNAAGGQSGNDNESSKTKSSGKKTPYEPKPMPLWFTVPTVHVEEDLHENQLIHSSSQPHFNSPSLLRQISNPKLPKSVTVQDIKQMLLVNESRGKKPLLSVTIEDSMSPPTPNQTTKLRGNSSLSSNTQSKLNSGAAGSNTDDDDASTSLFHTVNEDSVHHMDMDM